eukprot:scaffold10560_cov133-Isochrysis_galbana.AAC.22
MPIQGREAINSSWTEASSSSPLAHSSQRASAARTSVASTLEAAAAGAEPSPNWASSGGRVERSVRIGAVLKIDGFDELAHNPVDRDDAQCERACLGDKPPLQKRCHRQRVGDGPHLARRPEHAVTPDAEPVQTGRVARRRAFGCAQQSALHVARGLSSGAALACGDDLEGSTEVTRQDDTAWGAPDGLRLGMSAAEEPCGEHHARLARRWKEHPAKLGHGRRGRIVTMRRQMRATGEEQRPQQLGCGVAPDRRVGATGSAHGAGRRRAGLPRIEVGKGDLSAQR